MSWCRDIVLRWYVSCCVVISCISSVSRAHVALDSPTGGDTLIAGATFTIEWHPVVQHDTIDWDLWYSTASSSGPWEPIQLDLPLGNPAEGTPHFFAWTVPDIIDSTAWVRVRQDNNFDPNYYDTNDNAFSILAQGDFDGNGQVGSADLLAWETGYGTAAGALHGNGDANLDRRVDGSDFLIWQHQASGVAQIAASRAVPEPNAVFLFTLGCAFAFRRGRC